MEEWSPLNPDWIILKSVGIDIGSSTSHLMFSRLLLHRRGLQLSSRFEVVEREVLHRSPILLTPYSDIETIDTARLDAFISQAYRDAGMDPSHIDTGAVICTGEAVRKKNAEAITRLFSSQAGKFVCATAGPNLEAILAAHGSGAVARSRDGRTWMNVDIGGGTCKVAVAANGVVLDTAAVNVGARLVAWDDTGRINRIEEAGRRVASSLGIELRLGALLSHEEKSALATALADLLFAFLQRRPTSPLLESLLITPPLSYDRGVDGLIFSGGVAEYIYQYESRDYGDLGPLLGEEVRKRIPGLGLPVEEPSERIRATVIGASQYTIQVSSSTIFLSRDGLLPIRDLQVISPRLQGEMVTPEAVSSAIRRAFQRFDLLDHQRAVALSLSWPLEPSYHSLKTLAQGIALGLERKQDPLVLVFDADIGGLVGALLKRELGVDYDVVAVDEIQVGDFDFIDIGEELGTSQAVPVVVKSLVFS